MNDRKNVTILILASKCLPAEGAQVCHIKSEKEHTFSPHQERPLFLLSRNRMLNTLNVSGLTSLLKFQVQFLENKNHFITFPSIKEVNNTVQKSWLYEQYT